MIKQQRFYMFDQYVIFLGKWLCCVALVLFLVAGCKQTQQYSGGDSVMELKNINDIIQQKWNDLGKKKIYFAHQSVGDNIVAGIKDLASEHNQIKLDIIKTRGESAISGPIFAHSLIGRNMNPGSKMEDFLSVLASGFGEQIDIAILKFCFIDVAASTDIDKLFAKYKDLVSGITIKYPNLKFIVATVPIVMQDNSLKGDLKFLVKKIMGKEDYGYRANIAREKFNNLVREEFGGKYPIFDIAKIEASTKDGKQLQFDRKGTKTLAMLPEYSSDGEHLSVTGRKIVAEQFLVLLASIAGDER